MIVGTGGDGANDIGERNVFGPGAPDAVWVESTVNHIIAGNYFGLSPNGSLTNSGTTIEVSGIPLSTTGFEIRDNTFGMVECAIDSFAEGGDVLITGNTFGIYNAGTPHGSIVAIRAGGSSPYEIS